MEIFNEQIDKALGFAVKAHKNQFRKTDPSLPYIYHPVSVGFILLRAGFSDDVVIAGILHDVIEDCGTTPEELRQNFGEKITEMIEAVSENKGDPWEKRKYDYLNKILESPPDIKAIAVADKLHNIYSLITAFKSGVEVENVLRRDKKTTIKFYTDFTESMAKNWTHPLVDELVDMLEQLGG